MKARLGLSGLFLVATLVFGGCISQDEATKSVQKMASQWGGDNYSVHEIDFREGNYRFLVCTATGRLLYVRINSVGFNDVDEVHEMRQSTVRCVNNTTQIKSPDPSNP